MDFIITLILPLVLLPFFWFLLDIVGEFLTDAFREIFRNFPR